MTDDGTGEVNDEAPEPDVLEQRQEVVEGEAETDHGERTRVESFDAEVPEPDAQEQRRPVQPDGDRRRAGLDTPDADEAGAPDG